MTSPMGGFPRPSLETIYAALSGGISSRTFRGTGLPGGGQVGHILWLNLDIHGNFFAGALANASRVDKLGMSFKSWTKPLKTVLDTVLIPSIIKNFAEQGRPKWRVLSKRTILNRQYEGYPRGPILDKTGRLKKAASRKNNWQIQTNVLKFRAAFFTQSVRYAGYHQMGSVTEYVPTGHILMYPEHPIGMFWVQTQSEGGHDLFKVRHRMVARPFIQLTVDEEIEVYGIFAAYMNEQVDKYWGKGSNL